MWTGTRAVLYLHVCHVVLAPVEGDITDLAAVVHHRVQHARGLLAMGLPELQQLFGVPGTGPAKS